MKIIYSLPSSKRWFHCSCAFILSLFVVNGFQPGLAGPAGFTGEKALAYLKATGTSDSLAQAITAARYRIREIEGDSEKAWAQNPKHGLSSRIDRVGLRLTVRTPEKESFSTRWKLMELGYGGNRQTVSAGQLQRDGQRAEIVRGGLGLTEWFVNSPDGLEHGFTLLERPVNPVESDGPLTLTLAISGDLDACSQPDGQSLHLSDPETGSTILTYDKLQVWDADERALPARMRAEDNAITLEVDDTDARYPLTIDPLFTQQTYLKASNANSDDQFGFAVAVDGNTAVVGAYREDGDAASTAAVPNENASNAGAVYVFTRTGVSWTQEAYLKAFNAGENDEFGISVAIAGDTIVVGAYAEAGDASSTAAAPNDNASQAGAAYVFTRTGATWTPQAYLKASNAEGGDQFGYSVAVSGDTAVVGASAEDGDASSTTGTPNNNALYAGAAYVFARDAMGNWTQQAYLKASNAGQSDSFGYSVAVSGDTVVVGAFKEAGDMASTATVPNNNAPVAGAAYVFTRISATWTQQAYLKASNAEGNDSFGTSVAVSGDTAVIGANGEAGDASSTTAAPNNNASHAGAAYVFTRTGVTWSQQDYLKASNAGSGDRFGCGVSVDGDTVIVGAESEDGDASSTGATSNNNASYAGAAYVFTRTGASWTQQNYLKAANAGAGDDFGFAVAVSGDTVMVGAFVEAGDASSTAAVPNDNASSAGAAYTFDAPVIDNTAAIRKLKRQIAKVKRQIKRAKKTGNRRQVAKLKKKLRRLTRRLKKL